MISPESSLLTPHSSLLTESASLRERLLALVGASYDDPRFEPDNCWGFVRHCYALAGITLPKNIWSCRHICQEVKSKESGVSGPVSSFLTPHSFRLLDVIYFRAFLLEARHVGVVLDRLYFLQSSRSTNGVAMIRLNREGVREAIVGIYRLKDGQHLTPEMQ